MSEQHASVRFPFGSARRIPENRCVKNLYINKMNCPQLYYSIRYNVFIKSKNQQQQQPKTHRYIQTIQTIEIYAHINL